MFVGEGSDQGLCAAKSARTTAMQRILAILTQCLPHRQDIHTFLLHNRITGSLRKPITGPHRSLMPTETKQHGHTNPSNLTKAGQTKMITPLKYTETLMLLPVAAGGGAEGEQPFISSL